MSKDELLERLIHSTNTVRVKYGAHSGLAVEGDQCVNTLCRRWEDVLLHKVRFRKSIIIPGLIKDTDDDILVWDLITRYLSKSDVLRFENEVSLKSGIGRFRSWLRSTLNDGLLEKYLISISQTDINLLRNYYEQGSVMLEVNISETLPSLAHSISSVLFSFDLDREAFNSPLRSDRTLSATMSLITTGQVSSKRKSKIKRPEIKDESETCHTEDVQDKLKELANDIILQDTDTTIDFDVLSGLLQNSPGDQDFRMRLQTGGLGISIESVTRHCPSSIPEEEENNIVQMEEDETVLKPTNLSVSDILEESFEIGLEMRSETPASPEIVEESNPINNTSTMVTTPNNNTATMVTTPNNNTATMVTQWVKETSTHPNTTETDSADVGNIGVTRTLSLSGTTPTTVTSITPTTVTPNNVTNVTGNQLLDKFNSSTDVLSASESDSYTDIELTRVSDLPRSSSVISISKPYSVDLARESMAISDYAISYDCTMIHNESYKKIPTLTTPSSLSHLSPPLSPLLPRNTPPLSTFLIVKSVHTETAFPRSVRVETAFPKSTPIKPLGSPGTRSPARSRSFASGSSAKQCPTTDPPVFDLDEYANIDAVSLSSDISSVRDVAGSLMSLGDGIEFTDSIDSSHTTGEIRNVLATILQQKEEVEEQNKDLQDMLSKEIEFKVSLKEEIDLMKNQFLQRQEHDQIVIRGLQRENQMLKQQLKKYVNAIQQMRRDDVMPTDNDITAVLVEVPVIQPLQLPAPTPLNSFDAAGLEQKLAQVSEMHGELVELNQILVTKNLAREREFQELQAKLKEIEYKDQSNKEKRKLKKTMNGIAENEEFQIVESPLLRTWIPAAMTRGEGSEKHHVYQIIMQVPGEQWSVYKRYAEFRAFHKKIIQKYRYFTKVEFPGKNHFNRRVPSVVEERRSKLEVYLQTITSNLADRKLGVDTEIMDLQASPSKASVTSAIHFFRETHTHDERYDGV